MTITINYAGCGTCSRIQCACNNKLSKNNKNKNNNNNKLN